MAAEEKLKSYLAGFRCLQVTGILRDIAKTIVLVGVFFTFSISLTFYNKWTLSVSLLQSDPVTYLYDVLTCVFIYFRRKTSDFLCPSLVYI